MRKVSMYKIISIVLMTLVFSACGSRDLSNPGLPITTPIPTSSSISAQSYPTSQTPTNPPSLISSNTPTPTTKTPNASVSNQLSVDCVEIFSQPSSEIESAGSLILTDNRYTSLFRYDTQTKTKTLLSRNDQGTVLWPAISPDQNRIAYKKYEPDNPSAQPLVIYSLTTATEKEIPWNTRWNQVIGWLDNEWLWLSQDINSSEPLLLYNPTDDETKEINQEFPYLDFSHPPGINWGRFGSYGYVFNPTLSRVVYLEQNNALILYDVPNDLLVKRITTEYYYPNVPAWSPDGDEFVVNLQVEELAKHSKGFFEELYLVDRGGETSRLTTLTDHYSNVEIPNYSWSPDGRYIAFLVLLSPQDYPLSYPDLSDPITPRLGILDTTTGEVHNYCLTGDSLHGPVWSPDNRMLTLSYPYGPQPFRLNDMYIFDIQEKTAYLIDEDAIPWGWLREGE